MTEKWKETLVDCTEGDVTMPKLSLWLLAALCFTVGIIYGLLLAPWTRGITLGCNNVSQKDCCLGGCEDMDKEEGKKR